MSASSGSNENLERFPGGQPPPRPPGGWGGGGESTASLLCATYNNIGALYFNLDDERQSRSYLQLAVHTMMDHVVFITPSMQERRQQIIDNAGYPQEDRQSRLAIAYGEAVALEQALISRYSNSTESTTGPTGDGTGTADIAESDGSIRSTCKSDGSSSTSRSAADAAICSPIFINKETMRLSSAVDIYRNSATMLFNMAISYMHSLVSAEREEYTNRTHKELKRAYEHAKLFFNLSIEALNTGVSEVHEDEQRRRGQAQQEEKESVDSLAHSESALFRFHMCRDSILRVLITHQQNNLEQMKARYLQISQPSTQGRSSTTAST